MAIFSDAMVIVINHCYCILLYFAIKAVIKRKNLEFARLNLTNYIHKHRAKVAKIKLRKCKKLNCSLFVKIR